MHENEQPSLPIFDVPDPVVTYRVGDATCPPSPHPIVIAHVCNDIGAWGAGFVVPLAKRYPTARSSYRAWHAGTDREAGPFRLGATQMVPVSDAPPRWVANMVAQSGVRGRSNPIPLRYDALAECLAHTFGFAARINGEVHMPRIGCGLAGGRWDRVVELVSAAARRTDVPVTVWDLDA